MRISDWSSDVCSSDLSAPASASPSSPPTPPTARTCCVPPTPRCTRQRPAAATASSSPASWPTGGRGRVEAKSVRIVPADHIARDASQPIHRRSEEHTSELQSLMRISYAVFCLKKKNKYNTPKSSYITKH